MDWLRFLSGTTAGDYVYQDLPYDQLIQRAASMISKADAVLVGAGAGLSAAAGLTYTGRRFKENFSEFIGRYGPAAMRDMYAAGFYPFPTEEERWGYWSKHVWVNRIEPGALPLYRKLCDMVTTRKHFVLTTNVDHQFWKAGFEDKNIFATQGDYGKIQCAGACHDVTYDATDLFARMNEARKGCVIPSCMVPVCPVCGGPMAMNLRCDQYFVEDDHWHQAAKRYSAFLEQAALKETVVLELGVGFNTPAIIRFPFEKMVRQNGRWSFIRLNTHGAAVPADVEKRAAGINGDMTESLEGICRALEGKTLEGRASDNGTDRERRHDT